MLALGTRAAVFPDHDSPALATDEAEPRDVLILFLHIHSYKRLVPTCGPFTSAFDGYLLALSPIKVSFRSVPAMRYSVPFLSLMTVCSIEEPLTNSFLRHGFVFSFFKIPLAEIMMWYPVQNR